MNQQIMLVTRKGPKNLDTSSIMAGNVPGVIPGLNFVAKAIFHNPDAVRSAGTASIQVERSWGKNIPKAARARV